MAGAGELFPSATHEQLEPTCKQGFNKRWGTGPRLPLMHPTTESQVALIYPAGEPRVPLVHPVNKEPVSSTTCDRRRDGDGSHATCS